MPLTLWSLGHPRSQPPFIKDVPERPIFKIAYDRYGHGADVTQM